MKKSRLLIAVLLMLVASSGYAQDSYREAVKDYFSFFAKDYLNQMDTVFKPSLKSGNAFWFEKGNLEMDQLVERYVDERLLDYMTDLILPQIKELGVSEAGLREAISLYSTPAGETYTEHMKQLTRVMQSELFPIIIQDSLKIMNGDTSDPIQIKDGIDAGYVEKYKEIMDDVMVNYAQGLIDQYSNLFSMILEKMPDELSTIQNKLAGFKAWSAANLPSIMLNCSYGIITEDDLDFIAKLRNISTHQLIGLLPMSKVDMMSMGYGVILDYMEWMEGQGAVLMPNVKEDILKMINRGN